MMNNKPPVSLDGCTLYKDEFGNFVIHLKVKNISDKQIDGYKAVIACKNHFDEPVKPVDKNAAHTCDFSRELAALTN